MNKNQVINLTIVDRDKNAKVERTFNCADCVDVDTCNGTARDCRYIFSVSACALCTKVDRKDEKNIAVVASADRYTFEKARLKIHNVTQQFTKHK